ncbi:MAG: DNA-binding proteins Bright/BRCAA1/RBP1 and proteins containing BRIGHT domain [Pycnora praestabilis]|nr:MAG: DNA-binding proteins Bright/BRCAA1/RBP1 and proteins containing BRIGHT domain [Pycnora praestabilis]
MASTKNISSIAMALAGKTAQVEIPKLRESRDGNHFAGRDSFAAVAARSLPATKQTNTLPTPPNSISPSLPPHGFKAQEAAASIARRAPVLVDSDIDLQDAVDHAKSQDQPQQGYAAANENGSAVGFDAAGAITPGLLAKHHLPGILLLNGPLAIRHVMGHLTTSVPGFSRIPPAKARRLVVGALEGRGSGGEGGGVNRDVEFEKVGWGRWDARLKGNPSRDSRVLQQSNEPGDTLSPPASIPLSYVGRGLQIPNGNGRADRVREELSGTSWAGDSAVYSHDEEMETRFSEDITMLEHEADKMSLDGDGYCSSSEAPDEGPVLDADLGDVTDDEDWANIGAAALRQGSIPMSGGGCNHVSANVYGNRGGGPASSALAKSMPSAHILQQDHDSVESFPPCNFNMGSDLQEREAIEALLRLSSV